MHMFTYFVGLYLPRLSLLYIVVHTTYPMCVVVRYDKYYTYTTTSPASNY